MFLQLKQACDKISQHQFITLDLRKIQNDNYKLFIVNMITKKMYAFVKYKTLDKKQPCKIYLLDNRENAAIINTIIKKMIIMNESRDLQNEPANIITPATFCSRTRSMFKNLSSNVKISVFDDKTCKDKGLLLLHEMGKAGAHKSRFLIIEYAGATGAAGGALKTFGLLGKGVTFDAGGLNIKTGSSMSYAMKSDKTGGCAVVSIIKYLASINAKCNVVGLVPLIENMISGESVHPGNVIKSYNGKTVEVLDTDAEGRLILADALGYCNNYKLDYIFDMATLTGWTDYLHCDHSASFFTCNKHLCDLMCQLGEQIGERVIPLPMWPEYSMYTKSSIADFKNLQFSSCSRPGGFMASMFLYNFVPDNLKKKWIHMDISNNYTGSYSNGNCVLLCLELILKLC
jgi:leucyl aminopeptidase